MKKMSAFLVSVLCASLLLTGCKPADNLPQDSVPESGSSYFSSAESNQSTEFFSSSSSSSASFSSSASSSTSVSSSTSTTSSTSASSSGGTSASSTKSSSVSSSSKAPESSELPEIPDIPELPEKGDTEAIARKLLSQMTLREKIGQLFIVRPESLAMPNVRLSVNYKSVSAMSEEMRKNFAEYPVGGVTLFADNILTPEQTIAFNKELLNACGIPLFISVDEEGGRVARLANNSAFGLKKYESAMAVGRTGDTAAALEMGNTIGGYLKKYGFNMDFAPDADVFTNPANTVIGNRAFSSNASTAAKMAKAMAKGLRNNGIIPVYKHFPGHGDTSEDSHSGAAYANKTHDEMAGCEWLPFMEAGSLDGIMAGHISAPKITGDNVPATMSKQMITDILRGELGFDGLVITDALAMGAISKVYSGKQAAVNAILAGCDILLLPDNLKESFDGVLSAVNDGTVSEARIDESVLRVLRFKLEYGIIEV